MASISVHSGMLACFISSTNDILYKNSSYSRYAGLSGTGGWGVGINQDIDSSPYFYVDDNGNIGIGTTGPATLLQINGTDPLIRLSGDPTGEAHTFGLDANGFVIYNQNDSRYDMVIDNSGNVGIGATSPQAKLTLAGDMNFSQWGKLVNGSVKNLVNNTETNIARINLIGLNWTAFYIKVTVVGGSCTDRASRCVAAGFYGYSTVVPTKVGSDAVIWNFSTSNEPIIKFTLASGMVTISLKQVSGYNLDFSYEIEVMSCSQPGLDAATITLL